MRKMKKELKKEIMDLVENAKDIFVSSIDENGFPNTKAMMSLQHDDLFTHYFSTNFSAKRTQQFLKNPKSCIYFCNEAEFRGLMLIGTMEVCTDIEHKAMLWHEGFEIYYPDGINTEDYCILKFTSEKGNYYHGLKNITFFAEDVKDGDD